jgi:LTXXQ motif family protein
MATCQAPRTIQAAAKFYYGGAPAGRLDVTKEDRQALAETNAAAMESCNGLAPGVSDLPIEQIKKTVRPTGDQLAVLDELKAAALKAQETVKASCPTAVPLTPVARLDAAEARLDTMIQAVQVVRDPLERFYDSLNDEQRHSFETLGSSGGGGRAPAGGNLAALCNQQSGDVAKLPVERIEQVVQPNGQQQQDAFNALKQASHDAAEQLQASCPKEVPQTPVARLDAVKTRLEAMVEAMKTIRPKLQDFYTSLSDEQKAKFNIMGPAQSAASGAQPEN